MKANAKIGYPKAFPKGDYQVDTLSPLVSGRGLAVATFANDGATVVVPAEPKGRTLALPAAEAIPRLLRGFAATPEGAFVLHPNDHRVVFAGPDGAPIARYEAPELKHTVAFLAHPAGRELTLVLDEAGAGLPTAARIVRLSFDGAFHAEELATRPYRPAVAYGADGTLVAVDSREARFFSPGAAAPEVVSLGEKGPIDPMRLSVSGDRLAMWHTNTGGALLVYDRSGAQVAEIQGLIAERAVLAEGGKTLVLTAEAAKSRTGSASYVPWPTPGMLESYVGLLDVETVTLKGKLLPRAAGNTHALVVIEGEVVAVGSYGRSRKVELFAWNDLTSA